MSERVVYGRRARSTGLLVLLVDRGADDDEENRWETICVEHGGVCSHPTRAFARAWMAAPEEWCEDCMYGVGTLAGAS